MKKRIIKIIGISFAFLFLVIGSGVGLYVASRSTKAQTPIVEHNVVPDGAVFTEENSTNLKLETSRGRRFANTDKPFTEYVVTAVVEPVGAPISWSLSWNDKDSSWATGKDVSNYITLNKQSDLSITLLVWKDFGEQIILTCSSVLNSNVSASCTIDYAKRILDISATYTADGGSDCAECDNDCTINNGGTFNNLRMGSDLEWEDAFSYELIYSDYTIDVSYSAGNLRLRESSALQPALNSFTWLSIDDSSPVVESSFFDYCVTNDYGIGMIYDYLYDDSYNSPSEDEILAFYNANKDLVFAQGSLSFIGEVPLVDIELEYVFSFSFQFAGTDRTVWQSVSLDYRTIVI